MRYGLINQNAVQSLSHQFAINSATCPMSMAISPNALAGRPIPKNSAIQMKLSPSWIVYRVWAERLAAWTAGRRDCDATAVAW